MIYIAKLWLCSINSKNTLMHLEKHQDKAQNGDFD